MTADGDKGGVTAPHWVVFDYGEVISARTEALPDLAARFGVGLAEFEPAYWASRERYDRGATDLTYWRAVGDALGQDVDEATAADLTKLDVNGWSRVDPATVALLESLAADGTPLALLSNAPASFARSAERQAWARHFRHTLFSGDIGMAKPDAEIFALLTSRLGARPEQCLFLDDRKSNVDGARAAGLRAHRWRGAADARALLAN